MTGQTSSPRVLHLDHTGAPGGAEYALLRMFRPLPPWHPFLLLPPGAADGVFSGLARGVPRGTTGVAQPPGVSGGGPGAVARAAVLLVAQAVATRVHAAFRTADVIDANTARAAAYGALAAWTARVPFVVHLRDMVDARALGASGAWLMSRIALPRAAGVVSDTAATLASAEPYLRRDAVRAVIPSASGLRSRADVAPLPRTALRIGMLARIDPWKGQDLLLEAFARALPEGRARLVFAGSAPFGHEGFLARLRSRAAELGVGDRVDFLGHVDDVDALLDSWHVGVQYSTRAEPLGQNVLQYLAAGRVPVVADEGGPTEWVADGVNGVRVPPRDVDALSAALRRLADDATLRRSLAAGARETPGLLDDEAVALRHAEFYGQVLDRRATRSRR